MINKKLKITLANKKIVFIAINMEYFSGKIRAGRGFLQWKQEDLATKSGVSLPAIRKIEQGDSNPNTRTQKKITNAFEKSGIIFTGNGFEYVDNPTVYVEGKTHEETYLEVLNDVLEHLTSVKDPELLIMYADDRKSSLAVNDMYRKIRGHGVTMRQLIEDGNTYLLGETDEYRYVPKAHFINRVTLIYGDRIAKTTSDDLKASIKVDPVDAEIQRHTFNMLWSVLQSPTESTIDESF